MVTHATELLLNKCYFTFITITEFRETLEICFMLHSEM